MKKIHQEFLYQTRELGLQISDTLGEPPDRKRYARVIESLIGEYAKGTGIDDVNMLSFTLADHLVFGDEDGLIAEAAEYDDGDAAKVMKMVSTTTTTAGNALATVFANDPELARKAVITAFLFKKAKGGKEEDNSLDALLEEEDKQNNADEDEDDMLHGENIEHLFDTRGETND
ncbi:MAG: hypothetical protein PHH36_12785 [Sideroxydans sp.]|nr:hypothetical protein [Sideroxydans sp.]